MANELGQRIRVARRKAGFRNAESLAVALGVGARTVQRWEQGKSDPSITRLIEISKLTEHPLGFFVSDGVAA